MVKAVLSMLERSYENRTERVVRLIAYLVIALGIYEGLAHQGQHRFWLFLGLGAFLAVVELPHLLKRWNFPVGVLGLVALGVGLDLEPKQLSLYSILFHGSSAVIATRVSWPVAALTTLTAFLAQHGAQYGWFMGGDHRGHSHMLTDIAGIALLTVLVKELVEGHRRIASLNRRLQGLATTDDLTGLLNHRAIMERFDELLERQAPMAVVMMDLNNFKYFNDHFGHLIGDEVLRYLGRQLAEHLPSGAYAGRVGGDEFLVLLPGLARHEAAMWGGIFVEQLSARPVPLAHGHQAVVTASFGVAAYPADGQTRAALHIQADTDMYRGKTRNSHRPSAESAG